jgi:hypothetical protein
VVGHSLGAGAATLLALLLHPKYPQLTCYGYGVPGSVLDYDTACSMSSYTTSIVLGSDMICRLSFFSLSKLRDEVLDCICRSKVNKSKIIQSMFMKFESSELMSQTRHGHRIEEFLYSPGEEPESEFRTSVNNFKVLNHILCTSSSIVIFLFRLKQPKP